MKNPSCTPSVVGIFCAVLALAFTLRVEAAPGNFGSIQSPVFDGANVSETLEDGGVMLLAENVIGDGGRFNFETSNPGIVFENGKKKSKAKKAPKKKSPKEPKMPKQPKQPKQPKAPKATKQKKQKKAKKVKVKKQKK